MTSLVSLPQELVDMIFNDLTPADLGKVRLLSQDHNARFKGLFRYLIFQNLRIDLRSSCVERLIQFGEKCELASQLQNITVRPRQGEELKALQITPLLTKAFMGLPDIRKIEIDVAYGTGGFGYWKPVIDAVIRSKSKTVEAVSGPRCGIQMSKFKFSALQMKGYQTTFANLKTLDLTLAVQCERADLAEQFWSFIEKIGNNVEDLTVRTTRTSRNTPTPNAHGGYLPKEFNLPKLKALKLVDVAVTPMDLKKLLKNVATEAIVISQCWMRNPKEDWFEVVKHLRYGNFDKIKELRLALSGHYGSDNYDLPNLVIESKGDWRNEGNNCKVTLRSGLSKQYVTHKNLWHEIGATFETDWFWDSLTNSKWTSLRTTRWKRLQTAYETHRSAMAKLGYGYASDIDTYKAAIVQEQYDRTVREIKAEVDSDCEEVE